MLGGRNPWSEVGVSPVHEKRLESVIRHLVIQKLIEDGYLDPDSFLNPDDDGGWDDDGDDWFIDDEIDGCQHRPNRRRFCR